VKEKEVELFRTAVQVMSLKKNTKEAKDKKNKEKGQ
jgi:hypothetical protein